MPFCPEEYKTTIIETRGIRITLVLFSRDNHGILFQSKFHPGDTLDQMDKISKIRVLPDRTREAIFLATPLAKKIHVIPALQLHRELVQRHIPEPENTLLPRNVQPRVNLLHLHPRVFLLHLELLPRM